MPINKVDFAGQTLIDLTKDTVTAASLLQGITAHDKAGNPISGTASGPKPEQEKEITISENGDYSIPPDVGRVLSKVLAHVNVRGGGGGGNFGPNVHTLIYTPERSGAVTIPLPPDVSVDSIRAISVIRTATFSDDQGDHGWCAVSWARSNTKDSNHTNGLYAQGGFIFLSAKKEKPIEVGNDGINISAIGTAEIVPVPYLVIIVTV